VKEVYTGKNESTQIKIHGFPQRFPRRKKFWEEKGFLKYKSITKKAQENDKTAKKRIL